MKHILFIILLLASMGAKAQGYKITFVPQQVHPGTYYLAQHFRDKFNIVDSAMLEKTQMTFEGRKALEKGVYTLLDSNKKQIFDVMIDDSQKFSICYDAKHSNKGMKVKGSMANTLMFEYMAKLDWANATEKEYAATKQSNPEEYEKNHASLSKEMENYMNDYLSKNSKYRFAQLLKMFQNIEVPNEIPAGNKETNLRNWQASYYRSHFWDNVDLTDHNLIYTPQLFDKMNHYFFGLLYYQDADTITKYADKVLSRVENDSTMLRYFLDFIVPQYERATKNIGWDQVYVNLIQNYYLQGKCPWSTEADRYSKRNTVNFLSHSLIGAIGQELFMSDSSLSEDPRSWVSSHRFPERYVILWFWDPDCHHCQEQSAELAILYDSLNKAGNKRFEVYAVGYESDTDKWKRYIREHHFPFVNVGGTNVNIDYQEAYNVHGVPTMIILDADRRIIMNKVLQAKNIMSFLDNYEKEHPEMATKVTPWMMYHRKK